MPTQHHSHALKEAIIAHWQNGLPYSQIVKKINGSGIAKINKSSVWYQINKFKQTGKTGLMVMSFNKMELRLTHL